METEQRIVEQTRRSRRKGKSAIRNRKGEVSSVREEGADVQRSRTATRDRKEEAEAQQEAGSDEEASEPPIRDLKEAEQEVQRFWARYLLARNERALKREEERRSWLCHLPEYKTTRKEKVVEAKQKNQPTIKQKEEVVGEAAELPMTPLQDTEAAAPKEQFCATGTKKDCESGLQDCNSYPMDYNSDPMAAEAEMFRRNWNYVWARIYGSYEDITRIHPMMYTDKKCEPGHSLLQHMQTLQIFSVKIAEITGLPWPLDVFGMVAARDVLDHNRNVIFHRTRDNCQTISAKNPYLELTGPSRAVVVLDPVHLEVMLQVKGSDQSKDKEISFLVVRYVGSSTSGMDSQVQVIKRVCPSKLSTVELTYGGIAPSVEATISVQVVGGSWPDGFRGEFTASTTSLDDMKIQLLAFGDGKLPVAADGMVKLSRRVVSVERKGGLRVSVNAVDDQAVERKDSKVFRARRASRCKADLEVGSCKMTVTVAWSLLSDRQYHRGGSSE